PGTNEGPRRTGGLRPEARRGVATGGGDQVRAAHGGSGYRPSNDPGGDGGAAAAEWSGRGTVTGYEVMSGSRRSDRPGTRARSAPRSAADRRGGRSARARRAARWW